MHVLYGSYGLPLGRDSMSRVQCGTVLFFVSLCDCGLGVKKTIVKE